MQLQNTICDSIDLVAREYYGGNLVSIILKPAYEDTGVVFQTPKGNIKAKLDYASQHMSSIMLSDGNISVLNVEHLLATLYAYGIDNVLVDLKRIPSRSFKALSKLGLATKTEVVPIFEERENTLCEILDSVGLQQQKKERKFLKIANTIYTDRLSFEPIDKGLVIAATTEYHFPGRQTVSLEITPKSYKNEVSRARPYAKHVKTWMPRMLVGAIASTVYPNFGLGHGFNESIVFLPVKDKADWYRNQYYPAGDEIARHAIIDRLGALALLGGRLEGIRVTAKFSGHANDIRFLRQNLGKFYRSG